MRCALRGGGGGLRPFPMCARTAVMTATTAPTIKTHLAQTLCSRSTGGGRRIGPGRRRDGPFRGRCRRGRRGCGTGSRCSRAICCRSSGRGDGGSHGRGYRRSRFSHRCRRCSRRPCSRSGLRRGKRRCGCRPLPLIGCLCQRSGSQSEYQQCAGGKSRKPGHGKGPISGTIRASYTKIVRNLQPDQPDQR